MKNYVITLEKEFKKSENPNYAVGQSAYLKNLFLCFGIRTPERRRISSEFLKENGKPEIDELFDLIKLLWQKKERDFQYFGMDLVEKYMKNFREHDLEMIEYMITEKSWWETVDMVAAKYAGMYFKLFPEKIIPVTEKWMASGDMWLQRSALLFQLKYKLDTNIVLLFKYINELKDSKEFFLRKAIGWVLREYSKTNAEIVIAFVQENKLSPLSEKEALKWIREKTDILES